MTNDDADESGGSCPHDNDADSRPRIYMRSTSKHGEAEVTVHGAEGESADDIASLAAERFDHAVAGQRDLADDEPPERGSH